MELKWTDKALSDLARLYEFLAPVNQDAAARIVQSLVAAPATLMKSPRIGGKLLLTRQGVIDFGVLTESRPYSGICIRGSPDPT